MVRLWMILLLSAALVTGCGKREDASSPGELPAPAHGIAIGASAPDWTLQDLGGNAVQLSEFRGKKGVVVVFFATWCAICMEEVPDLIAFQKQFENEPVALLGIGVDQPAAVLQRFADNRKVNYRILPDPGGAVAAQYHVVGVPTIYGIDAQGVVRYSAHGLPADKQALVRQLVPAAE